MGPIMTVERKSKRSATISSIGHREYLGSVALATGGVDLTFFSSNDVSGSGTQVSVVERVQVTCGEVRHRAFPSLWRLSDETLLIFYREGTNHWRTDDSVLKLTRSNDRGITWTEPQTVLKEAGWGFAAHHGPRQLSDGSILAPAMSLRHGKGTREFRVYTLCSWDAGQTWKIQQIGPMSEWIWQNQ